MITLAVIGTNWISHQFVEAALATGKYQLTHVYSRKLETAKTFGEPYGENTACDDLADFLAGDWQVIYIASPNSLHYPQAKAAILAGKHVIVEKPAFSTPEEMATIQALAQKNNVYFFEAARNVHEKSFEKIAEFLPPMTEIIGGNFSYMKYSSRYDQVLAGEEPNIFSPHFSGGALMDLGVYLIYAAIGWFGAPEESHYFARKISTGVDGLGWGILRYPDFDVSIQPGKIGDAYLPSEIYFKEGTLVLNGVNAIETAEYHDRKSNSVSTLAIQVEENPMIEEANDFAQVMLQPDSPESQASYQTWLKMASEVNQVMYTMRQEAGIIFDAD